MQESIMRFRIRGMSCAACSSRIERVTGRLEGVAAMQVNLAGNSAQLTPSPALADDKEKLAALRADVVKTVSELGFEAIPIEPEADENDLWQQEQADSRQELATKKQRLIVECVFALPLVIVAMGSHWGLPLPAWLDPHLSPANFALFQLVLTLPVVWSGRDFYRLGLPALMRGGPNMDSLVALGTGAALLYSLWSTVEIFSGHPHAVMGLYYESAAMLIALISLGKYLETVSKRRTSEAIRGLMSLTPDSVPLVVSAPTPEEPLQPLTTEDVPVAHVVRGDHLLIRPGSRIPVDGTVLSGESALDMSSLTGESIPVDVVPGDAVAAGTMNVSGAFVMEASRVGSQTTLARIIRLVREAQGSKAPIANLADRVSLYFVPVVIAIALAAGAFWLLWGGLPFADALRTFVAVLVVACPCALGLATPMSIMVATGRGAQLGILVKSGASLEKAGHLDTLVFDKTGTLTEGRPALAETLPQPGFSPKSLLALSAALEALSEHPLAKAVVEEAKTRNLPLAAARGFQSVSGRGVMGEVEQNGAFVPVLIGNAAFLEEQGLPPLPAALTGELDRLADQGRTPLLVAVNGVLAGILALADPLRAETPALIRALGERGIRVILLSGDRERTARAIARQAGIEHVIAEVLPDGKERVIAALQAEGRRPGMVGDGVNDAPALARADVGLAMGNGIDVAMEAGDMVLLRGLPGVLTALELSRATMRNIRLSLFWAFAYNILLIPIAAGLLLFFGGPALSPMIAGAAMAASSVSVVTNALRLRGFQAATLKV